MKTIVWKHRRRAPLRRWPELLWLELLLQWDRWCLRRELAAKRRRFPGIEGLPDFQKCDQCVRALDALADSPAAKGPR